MTGNTHAIYEDRIRTYTRLIHGLNGFALIPKLAIYSSFVEKRKDYGESLWKIEPLLPYLLKSLELDLHMALAKFFDDDSYNVRKFLDFCLSCRKDIFWVSGNPPSELLFAQKKKLSEHGDTINSIIKRRNKFFAHSDKIYTAHPDRIYNDFPLKEAEVIDLTNCLVSIVHQHEIGLHPNQASFHLAEFFEISVDNMVRNLKTGRKINFPDQELD